MKPTYKKSIHGWDGRDRVSSYVGTLPNSIEGNKTYKEIKHRLELQGNRVSRRGRNPNRKQVAEKFGLSHSKLRQDFPIKYSTSFDIYSNPKSSHY